MKSSLPELYVMKRKELIVFKLKGLCICRKGGVLVCRYHPDAPLVEDYHAGDMVCQECGLVVGDRYENNTKQGV